MCGIKDNLLSNKRPRNFASLTTGMGLKFNQPVKFGEEFYEIFMLDTAQWSNSNESLQYDVLTAW